MSINDIALKNKVSTHIQHQLPEFIQADHPDFSKFVKLYYQFLESAEITFSEVNNYLRQETTSINFMLSEANEKVILEDSVVKFTVGETVTGNTSKATATVLVDDVDGSTARLFVSSQNRFIVGETITGSSSNSTGTIASYKPNPVTNIQQLLNMSNVDATIFQFLDNFRDAFLEGIVDNLATGVNKRSLIKNIRDLYIKKGTKRGHELFFRLLLNEEPTISFPNEQMIRLSDGNWTRKKIMRVLSNSGNPAELIGQVITGQTTTSTAIPVSVVTFRESGTTVYEIEIDEDTADETFQSGEEIVGTSSITDGDVSLTLLQIITGTSISDGGQYYTVGQKINVGAVSGSSNTGTAIIDQITTGTVDEIIIDDVGTNYAINDTINFNNTGTNGVNVSANVSVVGGAISGEEGDAAEYGMNVSTDGTAADGDEDHIVLEDTSQSFYNDPYDGVKIILESGTFNDIATNQTANSGQPHFDAYGFHNSGIANEIGSITDIRIINKGSGYTKLPLISSVSTTSGTGAKLKAATTNTIGGIDSVQITNNGFNYSSAPTLNAFRHAVLKDISGTFVVGANMTSHTGTITAYDADRQLLSMDTTANLAVGNTVAAGGASGKIANIGTASLTSSVGNITTTVGEFLGEEGKLSSDVMRIQDSNYYQDYSYVVKVGESINTWRDAIKSTVHPAGWAVFGEVEVKSRVKAGVVAQTLDSFTPELASLLTNLITTVFGRRLGTTDDGTSLRSSPKVGVDSHTDLTTTTRDTTLSRINTVVVGTARGLGLRGVVGPTIDLLPKYAFAVPPLSGSDEIIPHYPGIKRTARSSHNDNAYFTIEQFGNIRLEQVTDSNGNIPVLAGQTRHNVPPPGAIVITSSGAGVNAFDNNFVTFDDTLNTFDEDVGGGNTRVDAGTIYTSYDETGTKFDTTSIKFDVG